MQEKISDQWACWGLSVFIQLDLFCRNKNGSNIYDFIDSAARFGSFLLFWGFYWMAQFRKDRTLSERRVRHTVRTEHTSLNQAWTLLQHTCGKPHTTGGHTQWTRQVKATRLTINLQLHHRTAAQRPMLAHTHTKTALTSFFSSSVSVYLFRLTKTLSSALSGSLSNPRSHVNTEFYLCLLLSEAYLTLVCVRLFQRVWLVRCDASFPSIDGVFEPFGTRLFRVRLFFFSFLFNGNCFLHRNKV